MLRPDLVPLVQIVGHRGCHRRLLESVVEVEMAVVWGRQEVRGVKLCFETRWGQSRVRLEMTCRDPVVCMIGEYGHGPDQSLKSQSDYCIL